MNEIGSKFRSVDIVYDKVLSNIKKILIKYKKQESQDLEIQENKESQEIDNNTKAEYEKLLETNQADIKKFIDTHSKEQFEDIVKDKFKIVNTTNKGKDLNRFSLLNSGLSQNTQPQVPVGTLLEYNYEDEDDNKEDGLISADVNIMNKVYWNEEKRLRELEEKELRDRKAAKNA